MYGRGEARRLLSDQQDLYFPDVRQFKPGTHAELLLVRLREPGRQHPPGGGGADGVRS